MTGVQPAAPPLVSARRQLLEFLRGDWDLSRRLVDRRLGLEGRFEGVARFEPDGPGSARYHEEGVLTWPGHVGRAFRTLRCEGSDDDRVVALSFPDGRPFHLLELRRDGFEVEHPCGEDRYVGRFRLLGDDAWEADWSVDGPAKRLLLAATYRRIGHATAAPA